ATGDEQHAGLGSSTQDDPVGIVAVFEDCHLLREHVAPFDVDFATVYIYEGVVTGGKDLGKLRACGQMHVQVQRFSYFALDCPPDTVALPGDDRHRDALVGGEPRQFG